MTPDDISKLISEDIHFNNGILLEAAFSGVNEPLDYPTEWMKSAIKFMKDVLGVNPFEIATYHERFKLEVDQPKSRLLDTITNTFKTGRRETQPAEQEPIDPADWWKIGKGQTAYSSEEFAQPDDEKPDDYMDGDEEPENRVRGVKIFNIQAPMLYYKINGVTVGLVRSTEIVDKSFMRHEDGSLFWLGRPIKNDSICALYAKGSDSVPVLANAYHFGEGNILFDVPTDRLSSSDKEIVDYIKASVLE